MTRLASILGVATVATLVLLSGCEQAVKTDYTKKLDGKWSVDTMTMQPNPAAPTMTIPVQTTVTVDIEDGSGVNTGTFMVTVTLPGEAGPVNTVGSGSINDASNSELKVTLKEIEGPMVPAQVSALIDSEQTIGYAHDGNELTITSQLLVALRVAAADMPSLTLTKQ